MIRCPDCNRPTRVTETRGDERIRECSQGHRHWFKETALRPVRPYRKAGACAALALAACGGGGDADTDKPVTGIEPIVHYAPLKNNAPR